MAQTIVSCGVGVEYDSLAFMASIQDYEGFEIKITPEYTNWWSYYIKFFYKGKPLFNPEIFKTAEDIKADEYSSWALLPMLEKAIECKTPEERFGWSEWEDEASVSVQYQKINQQADDGFFIFEAFVSSWSFNDGRSNTMNNPVGLRLMMVERDILKKFYEELKKEMSDVAIRVTDELSKKNDKDYDDHIKFLKPYIIGK